MTIRWRIGGAMAIIAALVSIAGSFAAYTSTDAELSQSVDSDLLDAASRILDVPRKNESQENGGEENHEEQGQEITPARQSDVCPLALLQPIDAAQLINSDGTAEPCFTGSPTLPIGTRDLGVASTGGADFDDFFLHTVNVQGISYRIIAVPWSTHGAVQYGRNLESTAEVLTGMKVRLALAGLLATLAAWLLGWFIAGRLARPIRRLSVVATEVATTRNLSIKVPTKGTGEVGELGRSFSSMMTALSTSLEQQHRLVSDASHELRTPLTALRTNVESLEIFQEIPEEERRAMIRDIRLEVEELATLTAELVDLATDQLRSAEPKETVDLLTLTREIAERARRRSARPITVIDGGGNAVDGHANQLLRAISNLVDNAIKYSPEGSPIEITVDGGVIRVRDHGPGIKDIDLPHIFERFYRSQETRSAPGSGLGLAIVADAVNRHHGVVFAANAEDGGAIVGFNVPEP
ncbi:MAG: HAMP domain-containing sensor histidine kinase [Actinobacteria bacterium]|nr:HAMP domain-containing sensor histidine kinase [Actinomycetota bacterium]